jgi:hypothetical protein
MLATPEDEMAGTMSFASLTVAGVTDMEQRGEHISVYCWNVFFLKNGDPIVKTQRIFRKHFNIAHHGYVVCTMCIMTCDKWNYETSVKGVVYCDLP